MIIGTGDLAEVLEPVDRSDLTFFASGVSNSQCTDKVQFQREENLLMLHCSGHIVYFGSMSIYDKDSPYTRHKRHMENLVKRYANLYYNKVRQYYLGK